MLLIKTLLIVPETDFEACNLFRSATKLMIAVQANFLTPLPSVPSINNLRCQNRDTHHLGIYHYRRHAQSMHTIAWAVLVAILELRRYVDKL